MPNHEKGHQDHQRRYHNCANKGASTTGQEPSCTGIARHQVSYGWPRLAMEMEHHGTTLRLTKPSPQSQRNAGWPTGGRPLWSRSPRSSPRTGKPSTWRKRTGGFDGIRRRGMHNAKGRNCIERHTRTRRTRIAAGEHLSAALQPEPLPAGLRSHLLKPGSYDRGHHRRDRGWYVTGENRPHHRSLALRAVQVDAGATGQHSQA